MRSVLVPCLLLRGLAMHMGWAYGQLGWSFFPCESTGLWGFPWPALPSCMVLVLLLL